MRHISVHRQWLDPLRSPMNRKDNRLENSETAHVPNYPRLLCTLCTSLCELTDENNLIGVGKD